MNMHTHTCKTITPEWAAQILAHNNNRNRAVSRAHVEFLANEMRQGNWEDTSDTIKFCPDGELLDGQHRLAAVVKTGMSIRAWVAENVPARVFHAIDTNKRRSAGDTLRVGGEKNANRLASALVLIDRYLNGRVESNGVYSNKEIIDLLKKHPGVRDSIQRGKRSRRGL